MRILLPLVALSLLAGCSTIRKGLGEYQKAADKGVGINVGPDEAAEVQARKAKQPDLPKGLGGDKANAAYTSTPQ